MVIEIEHWWSRLESKMEGDPDPVLLSRLIHWTSLSSKFVGYETDWDDLVKNRT